MTIRYTCHSCGSKLNIKDELAGSAGKCPKCKTEFTVPEAPAADSEESPSQSAESSSAPVAESKPKDGKRRTSAKAKMPAQSAARSGGSDDDFDPVAFLMDDESPAADRKSSAPLSDDEIPAALELELSDDEEPPRRRSRGRRRVNLDDDDDVGFGSASASAGAMLSGGASAGAARDLLTRTVEESRARAARIDDDEQRGPSVVKEIAREVLVRGLPGLLGVVVLAGGVFYLARSVMIGGDKLPELGYVSGTVTLDGKPLARAKIVFRPVESEYKLSDTKSIRVRPSVAISDDKGRYELRYSEDVEGAVVGDHYVSISKRDGPRELAPSKYGPLSREIETVKSGSQVIDLTLTSDEPR